MKKRKIRPPKVDFDFTDLHHPPCRGYRANQAFYALGQIAQVLLRAVQYGALPKSARRHGIRPIVRYVMRTTAHIRRTYGAHGAHGAPCGPAPHPGLT